MRPDVSVVIPTRNRRSLLRRAIASALAQRGVELEVIVVDDGSDDGTADDVAALCRHRVRLVRHETNRGVSAARNAGIAHARAPWVAFLDDDDLWAPAKLEAQLAAVAAAGDAAPAGGRAAAGAGTGRSPDWTCTGCVLVDADDRLVGAVGTGGTVMDAARVLVSNAVPAGGSGVMARTAVLRDLRGFDERLSLYEDWDLWTRLALRGPGAAVDRPLVAYRVWRSTSSRELDLEGAWRTVTGRYAPEAAALGVRADIADLHRYRAYRALRSGRADDAADAYRLLAREESTGRSRSRLAALAASCAGGALLSALTWRDRRAVPAEVRAEAEAWLAACRT